MDPNEVPGKPVVRDERLGLGVVELDSLCERIGRVVGAGLAQIGVQEPTRRLVTGAVIVVAAIVDYYRTRR